MNIFLLNQHILFIKNIYYMNSLGFYDFFLKFPNSHIFCQWFTFYNDEIFKSTFWASGSLKSRVWILKSTVNLSQTIFFNQSNSVIFSFHCWKNFRSLRISLIHTLPYSFENLVFHLVIFPCSSAGNW